MVKSLLLLLIYTLSTLSTVTTAQINRNMSTVIRNHSEVELKSIRDNEIQNMSSFGNNQPNEEYQLIEALPLFVFASIEGAKNSLEGIWQTLFKQSEDIQTMVIQNQSEVLVNSSISSNADTICDSPEHCVTPQVSSHEAIVLAESLNNSLPAEINLQEIEEARQFPFGMANPLILPLIPFFTFMPILIANVAMGLLLFSYILKTRHELSPRLAELHQEQLNVLAGAAGIPQSVVNPPEEGADAAEAAGGTAGPIANPARKGQIFIRMPPNDLMNLSLDRIGRRLLWWGPITVALQVLSGSVLPARTVLGLVALVDLYYNKSSMLDVFTNNHF